MSIRKAAAGLALLLGLTVNGPVMGQNATARSTATPLKLNQFMKTPAKPARRAGAVATAAPRAKAAATPTVKRVASTASKKHAAKIKKKQTVTVAKTTHRPARPSDKPQPAQTTGLGPQEPSTQPTARADRVRVMSFSEVNEIDLAADSVQVADHEELNELDAAADAQAPSNPTQDVQGSNGAIATAAPASAPTDSSWMQRVLMAFGGVLATVAAIRFWVG
jgi:hypothetical protein